MQLYNVAYLDTPGSLHDVGTMMFEDKPCGPVGPPPEFILADTFTAAYNKATELAGSEYEVVRLELAIPKNKLVSVN